MGICFKHIFLPFLSDVFPPDSAPSGSAPVGVSPLSWSTDSDSSLWDEYV